AFKPAFSFWDRPRRVSRQGRASRRRTLPSGGIHHHRVDWDEPGRRPPLKPAWHRQAMDQGGQDRHPLDPPLLSPVRANQVAVAPRLDRLQLGNLLRRLVLPVAIADWSLTSLQQRLLKTGRAADPARPVLHAAARRKLLDRVALSPDSRAHRAAGVASDMIE